MSTKQRAARWRRKRLVRRIIVGVVACVVVLGGLVLNRMYQRAHTTASSSLSPTPSLSASTSTSTASKQATNSEAELNPSAAALSERVKEFAVIYYSFDGSDPAQREKNLSKFMTEETLKKLLEAEHSLPPYKLLIKNKAVRTAVVMSDPDLSFAGDDLAYVTVDVKIESADSQPETISSQTQWALPVGSLWKLISVELIAGEDAP